MASAAHPQQDEKKAGGEPSWLAGPGLPDDQRIKLAADAVPVDLLEENPFPPSMTVPGLNGKPVTVDLDVLDGVLYAPGLDDLELAPHVRQYVTQFCAVWSQSILTVGKLADSWPAPPRRAQILFGESQLHAMLGLAPDERLTQVIVDQATNAIRFFVESPRLPMMMSWNMEPPYAGLPLAAHYEVRQ
jgi:hypothetical protein